MNFPLEFIANLIIKYKPRHNLLRVIFGQAARLDLINKMHDGREMLSLEMIEDALQGDAPGTIKNVLDARSRHQGSHSLDEGRIDNLRLVYEGVHLF
jgi:hypothetical protein